ncbi:unnamed protein product [Larinioides sclopetarius]|uniref:Uncharacterized protein n=1 Tax=Larinioides sclopetarius TaxID=280406 RepID=A0AAV2A985_9ARAC
MTDGEIFMLLYLKIYFQSNMAGNSVIRN